MTEEAEQNIGQTNYIDPFKISQLKENCMQNEDDDVLIQKVVAYVTKNREKNLQNCTIHIHGKKINKKFTCGDGKTWIVLQLKDGELDVTYQEHNNYVIYDKGTLWASIMAEQNKIPKLDKEDKKLFKAVLGFVHKLPESESYIIRILGKDVNLNFECEEPAEDFLCELEEGKLKTTRQDSHKTICCNECITPEIVDKEIRNVANLLCEEDKKLLKEVALSIQKGEITLYDCAITVNGKEASFEFKVGECKERHRFQFSEQTEPTVIADSFHINQIKDFIIQLVTYPEFRSVLINGMRSVLSFAVWKLVAGIVKKLGGKCAVKPTNDKDMKGTVDFPECMELKSQMSQEGSEEVSSGKQTIKEVASEQPTSKEVASKQPTSLSKEVASQQATNKA